MSGGARAGVVIAALAAAACLEAPPDATGECPAPVAGDPDPLRGDVLTYSFDHDSNDTEIAHDTSGHRFDGAFEGGTIAEGGRYGDCAGSRLDGAALLVVPENPLLHPGSAITLETWVWRSRVQTAETLFSIYDGESTELILAMTADDGLVFGLSSGDCASPGLATIEVPAGSIEIGASTAGTFYHLAVSWDGEVARVYQYGSLVAEMPLSVTPCAIDRPLSIGATGIDIDPFEGYFDDVKVSSYAKNGGEIGASAAFDPTQAPPRCGDLVIEPGEECEATASCCDPVTCNYAPSSCDCDGTCVGGLCVGDESRTGVGLIALYDFDEGAGRTAFDTSGSGLDLEVSGDGFSWGPGQLTLLGDTTLVSGPSAEMMVEACRESEEVSVEAWLTPASIDLRQTIAVLGLGDDCQGFALTQSGERMSGAIWSSLTDSDGEPNIDTPDGSIGSDLVHVVLTRSRDGWRRIYVDARLVSENQVGGDLSTWDLSQHLAIGGPITDFSPMCEKGEAATWRGTIHRLAVYDRALSAAEVAGNYGAGPENETSGVR